ncbi:hypothetical protein KGM_205074 [Danaus plexippus plexippus]|uniref:Mab-21-like HhH/H2TH-like domain-containing protein n=1 Tax=Danaus plexippus plexippus TaxID=278856 RepID=A0A212FGV4_DANPL|nr:hypothetical protein KGM_205074 [Danaus plexippus plexippus]
MGNSKSKKVQREPDKFFERERWKEQRREEKKKKNLNPQNKRTAVVNPPINPTMALLPPSQGAMPRPPPSQNLSYDDEALDRMRYQLNNDCDAFLLNNILLSVQFFENYEREMSHIKSNPINESQHTMDEAMVQCHKHVFLADKIQECVQEHVLFQVKKDQIEPLVAPRLFIIYDNVEASEPGYVKLKKLEILESSLSKETAYKIQQRVSSDDSIYTDSAKESNASDDIPYSDKREKNLQKTKNKVSDTNIDSKQKNDVEFYDSRSRTSVNDVEMINKLYDTSHLLPNGNSSVMEVTFSKQNESDEYDIKARKSILKNTRRYSGPTKEIVNKSFSNNRRHTSLDNILSAEDTETSGYRSNASSRQAESSETESDYGYATITESTTPKKIGLNKRTNYPLASGVLPDESWISVNVKSIDWSDDEEGDTASKESLNRNLYETHNYLGSIAFMDDFVNNFILSLGSGLGFSQDTIKNSMTQGASIYCNAIQNGLTTGYEVFPALIAAWPNSANRWIIRERKIIQNPRTNFSYQWPTKYMVNKTVGFGCLLVPIGFRPKRGLNPEQQVQWKVIFPAAERYLESCLAHSHTRCYLFTLTLYRAFLENSTSKIGINESHIKNHLFWQCEDNYAKWPEDRLGESLRLFLGSFYAHFGQSRFPNYFIESCNEFKYIPKPLLLKLQRKLADILESPVMHVLNAIHKLKYTKRDFYPKFNCLRLYEILTCKNPLRILNPHLPIVAPYNETTDSEDEQIKNIWDRAKAHDKHYQWKKERQRQMREKRQSNNVYKKQRGSGKAEPEINKNIILPSKLPFERRRLVLEFFIPHFIAMARSSEKFEALRQAVIYLEQAQRLCYLLMEEASGELSAKEFLDIIRDKLSDCQQKLVNQEGYKFSIVEKNNAERKMASDIIRKRRPRCEHILNLASPMEGSSNTPVTFAEVHEQHKSRRDIKTYIDYDGSEESKL